MICLGENGSYSCYAKNRAGTGSTNFSLSVANDAGEVSGFLEIGLDHLVIFRKIILYIFDHNSLEIVASKLTINKNIIYKRYFTIKFQPPL